MSRAKEICELFKIKKKPSSRYWKGYPGSKNLSIAGWHNPHENIRSIIFGPGQGEDFTMADVKEAMPHVLNAFNKESKLVPGKPISVVLDLAYAKFKEPFSAELRKFHKQIGTDHWSMGPVKMAVSYAEEGPDEMMIWADFTPKEKK